MAHKVTDRVALKSHIPAVKKFLAFCDKQDKQLSTVASMDGALVCYLNWMCHVEHMPIESGKAVVFGVEYVFPECREKMSRAREDLISWAGFALTGEGQPASWEGVCGIAADMGARGDFEGADIAEIAATFTCARPIGTFYTMLTSATMSSTELRCSWGFLKGEKAPKQEFVRE